MSTSTAVVRLLKRIHANERGSVSLESVLIIAAIALPVLIFVLKFGWPKLKDFFNHGITDLEVERNRVLENN